MPATTYRTRAATRRESGSRDAQELSADYGWAVGNPLPGSTGSEEAASRLGQQAKVFRDGWRCEIGTDERSPFLERRRLAEIDDVILHAVPVDHQQVAIG